jgi:hypothetical protein
LCCCDSWSDLRGTRTRWHLLRSNSCHRHYLHCLLRSVYLHWYLYVLCQQVQWRRSGSDRLRGWLSDRGRWYLRHVLRQGHVHGCHLRSQQVRQRR